MDNYNLMNTFYRHLGSLPVFSAGEINIEIITVTKRRTMMKKLSKPLSGAFLCFSLFTTMTSQATVVEVRTVMGDFQINLFDETTPETVNNFLSYVNSGAYANHVVHRSEPGFVVQAGGLLNSGAIPLDVIATGSPVINEPVLSNVRGTIAMAKLPGNPNSATSQWFINLANNSTNLDVQNEGFTVFGQVLGDGMDVVDAIIQLDRFNFGGNESAIPLRDYTAADASSGVDVTQDNFVTITDIVVTDAATVTNPDITPTPNTLINSGNNNGGNDDNGNNNTGGSSGGGSVGFGLLLGLGILMFRRIAKR